MTKLEGRKRLGAYTGGPFGGVDFFKRVPRDLTEESTRLGVSISHAAIVLMAILFASETLAFFGTGNTGVYTSVAVDSDLPGGGSATPLLKISFNVTLHEVHCEHVAVDVLDTSGRRRRDVAKNVETWYVGSGGVRRRFDMRHDFRGRTMVKRVEEKPSRDHDRDTGTLAEQQPGCTVDGYLVVNRIPGSLRIGSIELIERGRPDAAAAINMTHTVHHLAFADAGWSAGTKREREQERLVALLPGGAITSPLDGRLYATEEYHEAFHHYVTVVPTRMGDGGASDAEAVPHGYSSRAAATAMRAVAYPFLGQSQVVEYDSMDLPSALFYYDVSPMSVVVNTKKCREWYDYVTSLCAIIGGTFTTMGLLESAMYKFKKLG